MTFIFSIAAYKFEESKTVVEISHCAGYGEFEDKHEANEWILARAKELYPKDSFYYRWSISLADVTGLITITDGDTAQAEPTLAQE